MIRLSVRPVVLVGNEPGAGAAVNLRASAQYRRR